MKQSVYLAGAMTARKDFGTTWRRMLAPKLKDIGYKVKDPTVFEKDIWTPLMKDYDAKSMKELSFISKESFSDIMKLIEEHDLHSIKYSDIVVFYLDKAAFRSDGTIHEIKYASDIGKRMVFIVKVSWSEIPSWCRWRVYRYGIEKGRYFNTFKSAVQYIKGGE